MKKYLILLLAPYMACAGSLMVITPDNKIESYTSPVKLKSNTIDAPVTIPQASGASVTTMNVTMPKMQVPSVAEAQTPPVPKSLSVNVLKMTQDLNLSNYTYDQLAAMPSLPGGPKEWRYMAERQMIFNINWINH